MISRGGISTLKYANIGGLKANVPVYGEKEMHFFSGLIDEVALFDRALPAEEVRLYYLTGLQALMLGAKKKEEDHEENNFNINAC